MSADNGILINKRTFRVTEYDASSGKSIQSSDKAKSLEEAIEIAEKIQEEYPVEYGIKFID